MKCCDDVGWLRDENARLEAANAALEAERGRLHGQMGVAWGMYNRSETLLIAAVREAMETKAANAAKDVALRPFVALLEQYITRSDYFENDTVVYAINDAQVTVADLFQARDAALSDGGEDFALRLSVAGDCEHGLAYSSHDCIRCWGDGTETLEDCIACSCITHHRQGECLRCDSAPQPYEGWLPPQTWCEAQTAINIVRGAGSTYPSRVGDCPTCDYHGPVNDSGNIFRHHRRRSDG